MSCQKPFKNWCIHRAQKWALMYVNVLGAALVGH